MQSDQSDLERQLLHQPVPGAAAGVNIKLGRCFGRTITAISIDLFQSVRPLLSGCSKTAVIAECRGKYSLAPAAVPGSLHCQGALRPTKNSPRQPISDRLRRPARLGPSSGVWLVVSLKRRRAAAGNHHWLIRVLELCRKTFGPTAGEFDAHQFPAAAQYGAPVTKAH